MRTRATAPVLFVLPPGGFISYFSEHLGTAFLRALLERAGIPARAYLPPRNPSPAELARHLRDARPRLVGLTLYETNLRACRALARVVRETLPEAVLAVGGPNATFTPEETLELLPADLCVRGAGEASVVALASAILGAERPRHRLAELLAAVPNLVVRTPAGVARTRAGSLASFPGPPFRTLDDLPSPYQDGIVETPDVGFLTARGCNQHCTYCSFAAVSARQVHPHSVERVLADLAAFKPLFERAPRRRSSVSIFDDAFTLAPERARAICEGIVARGLELPFDCETRADRVDRDLLRLMKRAGFVGVSFGLESAVPRVLRAMGKVRPPDARDDPELEAERAFLARLRAAVADAKALGLAPTVSIIGGLPGETAEDLRTTLAFVESLGVGMYAHNVLSLLPGTPLHRDRARAGLDAGRSPETGAWWTRHAYDVHSVVPLPSSVTHARRWDEASQVADALCGRDRPPRAGEGAPWAAVIHADAPDPATAEWLARSLAVDGAVVAVGTGGPWGEADRARWTRALDDAEVPYGLLAVLSRERGPRGSTLLRSIGPSGSHRFELRTAWRAGAPRVLADAAGHCRVPIWLASDPRATPPSRAGGVRTPQIADGCRFWDGWRRCRRPRVLHVAADRTVRPCWNGPAIGRVGDPFDLLAARAEALGRPGAAPAADRCPLGGATPRAAAATRRLEVAAQVCWVLPRYGNVE